MTLPSGTNASRAKANTTMRQKLKNKWDKRCKYDSESVLVDERLEGHYYEANVNSGEAENWCRLLDEGIVVDNSPWTGEPYAFACIKKGVIKKWYDALPNNFVGTIDKDHNRSIDLGTFTKKDLRLVEVGDGRYAVDVNVKLDHELFAVKDLIRANNRTALSVEMFINADEYAAASKITGEKIKDDYLVPLIDDLKIEGYAVCLAPKSANSYKDGLLEKAGATDNTNLTEEFSMEEDEKVQAPAEVTETTEQVDASAAAPEDELVNKEEAATDTEGDADAETDKGEAVDAGCDCPEGQCTCEGTETTEEATTEETADDTAEEKLSAIEAKMQEFAAAKAQYETYLAAKDAEIATLKAQLEAKTKKEESFESKLTSILSLAAAEEPEANEGGSTSEKTEDLAVDLYAAAFNEMENE